MSQFLHVLLFVTVLVGSAVVPVAIFAHGVHIHVETGNLRRGSLWIAGAVILFILELTTLTVSIPERPSLCTHGHEEYQLRGKITERVWVCEDPQ